MSDSELASVVNPSASKGVTNSDVENLFEWGWDHRGSSPTLFQNALDALSTPAMSVECEHAFSTAGFLVTPHRCSLQIDIIWASECLKTWWDGGMIAQYQGDGGGEV